MISIRVFVSKSGEMKKGSANVNQKGVKKKKNESNPRFPWSAWGASGERSKPKTFFVGDVSMMVDETFGNPSILVWSIRG